MELKILPEQQTESFDEEYHSEQDLALKVQTIRSLMPEGPARILDIGGGNGTFLDSLLQLFPKSEGYLLDVSEHLLSLNKPAARKHLLKGSCSELDALVKATKFDLITINFVLHHLVGSSYDQSVKNVIEMLELCRQRLTPNGSIVILEHMFDGLILSDGPSRIIYTITSVKAPWFAKLARRCFNTAGVGVCFHSQKTWEDLFRRAGLTVKKSYFGEYWPLKVVRRFVYSGLHIKSVRSGHYYLSPAK